MLLPENIDTGIVFRSASLNIEPASSILQPLSLNVESATPIKDFISSENNKAY